MYQTQDLHPSCPPSTIKPADLLHPRSHSHEFLNLRIGIGRLKLKFRSRDSICISAVNAIHCALTFAEEVVLRFPISQLSMRFFGRCQTCGCLVSRYMSMVQPIQAGVWYWEMWSIVANPKACEQLRYLCCRQDEMISLGSVVEMCRDK